MSPDEQEYASTRYAAAPLVLIPLASGRWAIGCGFNPRQLLDVLDEDEIVEYVRGYHAATLAEYEARRERESRRLELPSFDLDFALGDFTL